jgi:hypothetical protein
MLTKLCALTGVHIPDRLHTLPICYETQYPYHKGKLLHAQLQAYSGQLNRGGSTHRGDIVCAL